MTTILGFSGKKQSGKSTSANFLYALHLINTKEFKEVGINEKGTIEVTKRNGDFLHIDVCKYYMNIGDIDPEINEIIKYLSEYIKIYSFADLLKQEICMKILGLSYEQCYGTDDEKNQLSGCKLSNQELTSREVMQMVGTDFLRSIKHDVWPDATIRKIQSDNAKLAIITDCRFPNEVDFIHNAGGKVIRLTRHLPNLQNEHISEKILDKNTYDWNNFDYVIDNKDLNIEDQCKIVYEILTKELG